MAARRRLDAEMVRRNLAISRTAAQREITEGRVLVSGSVATKSSRMVDPAEDVKLIGPPPKYVSRAGNKLEGALEHFGVDPKGMRCLDAGSSTGGFTDCLLQRGAANVVAVDVGTHQLHERVRGDDRVDVREQTDIRSVTPSEVEGSLDLIVGDLSFISLKLVLESLFALANPETELLLLVKPQFEAGRKEVSRGNGVIRNPIIWQRVLTEIRHEVSRLGAVMAGVTISPITGRTGNVEFITRLVPGSAEPGSESMIAEEALADVVVEAAKGGML